MKKPVIGITPLWDIENEKMWMLSLYYEAIISSGGVPIILPLTSDEACIYSYCEMVDGMLFTGGQDINPALFNEEIHSSCGLIVKARDDMESALFTLFINNTNKPILGICRGFQLFNVMLGGKLYQDLPTFFKGIKQINHRQEQPYDTLTHTVKIIPDSPLDKLLFKGNNKDDLISVNSMHHQGISELASNLKPMAIAEDGLIEAVYMPDKKFAWAVQWHPEHTLNEVHSRKLFEAFVESCIDNKS